MDGLTDSYDRSRAGGYMYKSIVNIDGVYHACIVVNNVCYTDTTFYLQQSDAMSKATAVWDAMLGGIEEVLKNYNFVAEPGRRLT